MNLKAKTNRGHIAPILHCQLNSCALVFIILLINTLSSATDAKSFSIKSREDCVEINSKSGCQCESAFIEAVFEIMCPKPKTMMDRHKILIKAPIHSDQSLVIECSQMSARDYAIVPNMAIGNINIVQMKNCPLPGDASIAGIFDKLGVTNVTQLLYESNNLDGNLTRLHLSGLQNLRRLRLKLRNIAHLPDDLFHDLGNLKWLDFRSQNIELPANLFAPLQNLSYLELADNHLSNLPAEIFRNHQNLINLSLWGNDLRHLTKNTFESLSSLSSLDLSSNSIETLDSNIFEFLTNLSIINLNANRIQELPKGLFTYTKNLSEFRLGSNRVPLRTLPNGLLSDLPVLKKINLNCYLENIPADTFLNSRNIEQISLEYNHLTTLPETLFHDQEQLVELDLSTNRLIALPENLFEKNKNLKILKLFNNQLKEISGNIFTQLTSLEELYMHNNHLTTIDMNAFLGPRTLKIVELQNNRIKLSVPIIGESNSPFHTLSNLEELNLRNNSVMYTFSDWRLVLLSLKKLDLSYNNISSIDDGDLQYLSRAQLTINMTHNQINSINFLNIAYVNERGMDQQLILDLNNNPLNCDCVLPKFVQFIRGEYAQNLAANIKIKADNLICQQPENLKNKFVHDVSYNQLLCPLDHEDSKNKLCPSNCECSVRTYDYTCIVDCSRGNRTTIPKLPSATDLHLEATELNMSYNNLLYLPTMKLTGYTDVTKLLLTGNQLKDINAENLPPNLTHLDLRYNQFKQLNDSVLAYFNRSQKLNSIQLSNNPWHCDCKASNLLQYAQSHYKNISDLKDMRCSTPVNGIVFQKLSVSDICPVDQTIIVLLSMLAVFFFFIIVLSLFYMKYQIEIKVWLYAHNMCLWFVTEEELDKEKLYDAFISYSSKDEDFVAKVLVPNLEKGTPAFKICVHYRDFRVGQNIAVNIANAVDNSRRTIVILSKNFLESNWAREEFRTAHLAALEERKPKVIIILFGDIGNIDDLDAELKAYLKTNTYLAANDPWFWERLRYAMPHSTLRLNGLTKNHHIKSSVDDKLELINPSPVTPPMTTPPAEATKNPLIAHLNGGTPQTAIMIANGKNGHTPAYYANGGKLQNGHINGAFIINPNAKQSDV